MNMHSTGASTGPCASNTDVPRVKQTRFARGARIDAFVNRRVPRRCRLISSAIRRRAKAFASTVLALAIGWAGAAFARVEIVVSESVAAYAEARAELAAQLAGVELTVSTAESFPSARRANPSDVVVTLGSEAMRSALRLRDDAPIVTLLVPRDSFERLRDEARTAGHRRSISGIYLDQPWSRQIALIRQIVPDRRRIGVLSTDAFLPQLTGLDRIVRQQNATLVQELVESPQGLHVDLMRIIGTADALLAVPDTRIYNASTIQHILLTTFRARQPLIGFSPAYVQAGALAAVYSTPAQMAREAAAIVRRLLAGLAPSGGQYARTFTVNVNRSVARSLDILLEDDAALTKHLEQLERDR